MKAHRAAALAAIVAAPAAVLWASPAEAQPSGRAGRGRAAARQRGRHDRRGRSGVRPGGACGARGERGARRGGGPRNHPPSRPGDPQPGLDPRLLLHNDLFDYRAFDVLFDPRGALDDILDLARRRLCAAARDAYRRYLGRALDPSVYTRPARRLPGLDIDCSAATSSTTSRAGMRSCSARSWRADDEGKDRSGVLLAAILLGVCGEAHAHRCDRTDNDRREATRVIRDLTREIDAMERAIVEALRLQTGQLSGYTAQSAKAVTGALDSQTKLQAQIAREAAETEAMRARTPSGSGCEAITGLSGLAGTRAASESAGARAAATETGRIASDRAVVDRPGAAAGDAARFETVTGTYCNAARAGEDPALCAAGTGCTARICGPTRCSTAAPSRARRSCARRSSSRATSRPRWCTTRRRSPRPIPSASAGGFCSAARRTPARRWPRTTSRRPARCGLRARRWATGPHRWRRASDSDPTVPVSRYELLELLASRRFENPELVRRPAGHVGGEPAARAGHRAGGLAHARLAALPHRRAAGRRRCRLAGARGRKRCAAFPASPIRPRAPTERHAHAPLPVRPRARPPARRRAAVGLRAAAAGGGGASGEAGRMRGNGIAAGTGAVPFGPHARSAGAARGPRPRRARPGGGAAAGSRGRAVHRPRPLRRRRPGDARRPGLPGRPRQGASVRRGRHAVRLQRRRAGARRLPPGLARRRRHRGHRARRDASVSAPGRSSASSLPWL